MDPQPTVTAPGPEDAPPAGLSVVQRAVAVFARPAQAWSGLDQRAQWWFPLVLMTLLNIGLGVLLYDRAILPMIMDQWDEAVADGRMTPEAVANAGQFMRGPMGLVMSVVPQALGWIVFTLLAGVVVWFAVGFLLGARFRFRLALEAVLWSSLITIPGQLLTAAIAWSRETMQGVHIGFGVLVPLGDPPGRFQTGLAFFLDAIGPLSIWYVAVLVLGAAALSGAPRRRVAWAIGGCYVVLMLVFAALAGMFTRGGG